MTWSRKYLAPHPQVAGRVVEQEAVLVLPESGQINVLNSVGARIWELADGTRCLDEITAAIIAEYDVTPEQAAQDVEAFVQQLVDHQILIVTNQERTGS